MQTARPIFCWVNFYFACHLHSRLVWIRQVLGQNKFRPPHPPGVPYTYDPVPPCSIFIITAKWSKRLCSAPLHWASLDKFSIKCFQAIVYRGFAFIEQWPLQTQCGFHNVQVHTVSLAVFLPNLTWVTFAEFYREYGWVMVSDLYSLLLCDWCD